MTDYLYDTHVTATSLAFASNGDFSGTLHQSDASATVTIGEGGFVAFDLVGDYTSYPIAGVRVEVDLSPHGTLSWDMAFDATSDYFAIATDAPIDASVGSNVQDIGPAHVTSGTGFSITELVARTANAFGYQHGYGQIQCLSGDIFITRFHVIAYTIDTPPARSILRVHPRNDGRGTSGAPNLIGPRSQQASNRIAGGTYI